MTRVTQSVPCYRASLPAANRLLPYLERIDASRWYSNRGELVNEFEARLNDLLGGERAMVTTAASGTAALEGAILAAAGLASRQRPLALLPSYTFVATALALERCGYTPYLLDVDAATWSLEAARVARHPMLERAGVVVPVGAYGRPVAQAPWAAFVAATKVPVVIDAAAGFESLTEDPERLAGTVPVALSFHATKVLSTAEGGAVIWSDFDGLLRVVRSLNFGMLGKRECSGTGFNGRMSEYHAAIGLASLDGWEETRRANRSVAQAYRSAARARGVERNLVVAPDVASNYALFDAGSPAAGDDLVTALRAENIESRRWYGRGLHCEPYFRESASDPLPETDRIAPSLVGLPIYPDIATEDIERTVAVAARAGVTR